MLAGLESLGIVVLHTLVIYLFLVFCLRLIGRREIAQLTFAELTVLMVLGSSVETAMVAGNLSLLAGLTSATTLFLANRGLTFLIQRSPSFHHLIIGDPLVLVHNGRFVSTNLRAARITEADVLEAIRERGYASPRDLAFAVLEVDGSIGVVPLGAVVHRHHLRLPLADPPARG